MSNYSSLLTTITSNITENGNGEITGSILQSVLSSMVTTLGANATYVGVATSETTPSTPDGNCFYMASGGGTFTNFGGLEVDETKLTILHYDADTTTWSKEEIADLGESSASAITYDNTDSGLTATYVQDAIDELADNIITYVEL